MPRIARPPTAEAIEARSALARHLSSSGLSANSLASAAGVPQPTLSKFMTGRTKSVTPSIRKALAYAQIKLITGIHASATHVDNRRLRDALARTWDGSASHAEALAELIEAVGPVLLRYVRQKSAGRQP